MKTTVLLVDDNQELLDVLEDELREIYQVVTAVNGQEALDLLDTKSIQVIICDVAMPIMDGFEFCRIIKSRLAYYNVPVILLTARNTLQSKITGLGLGADAYIEKPFALEHLLVQIANLVTNRSNLRTYFSQFSGFSDIANVADLQSDDQFLDKLNKTVIENLDDAELDINKFASLMNMGRTTLFRKINSLCNLTPSEFVNITRFKKAAELLRETDYKIFEIAYMVGFSSQTTFGRSFLKQFGMSPTNYQKQTRK